MHCSARGMDRAGKLTIISKIFEKVKSHKFFYFTLERLTFEHGEIKDEYRSDPLFYFGSGH